MLSHFENKNHTGVVPSAPPSEDVSECDTYRSWSSHQDHSSFSQVSCKEYYTDSSLTDQIYLTALPVSSSDQTQESSTASDSLYTQTYLISKSRNPLIYVSIGNLPSTDINAGIFHGHSADAQHSQPSETTSGNFHDCSPKSQCNPQSMAVPFGNFHDSSPKSQQTPQSMDTPFGNFHDRSPKSQQNPQSMDIPFGNFHGLSPKSQNNPTTSDITASILRGHLPKSQHNPPTGISHCLPPKSPPIQTSNQCQLPYLFQTVY
uniref:Uncharacterized protein n=1 Tax=Arion vulgaris TaxID=1028688 RepID=A0A0B7AX34_9EUPU